MRRFGQTYDNVYSYYLDRPDDGVEHFACDWRVVMTEKDGDRVRVGTGRYEWGFGGALGLANSLVTALDPVRKYLARG